MGVLASEVSVYKTTNNLGGAITGVGSVSGVADNLFNVFSGAETSAGGTFYACVYVRNETVDVGNPVAQGLEVFIDSITVHAGAILSLGLGSAAIDAVEPTIANENTAPAGVTFFSEADAEDVDDNLIIGDLPANSFKSFWIRAVIDPATAAKASLVMSLKFKFDSVE